MDGQRAGQRRERVRGGVVGHPAFRLAQDALRVGVDPIGVLRPGDPFEKLIERLTIKAESRRRDKLIRDQEIAARQHAILTGQVVALCLGQPGDFVIAVGASVNEMLGGEVGGGG